MGGGLDAILSTDGDGDRPLLTDATGQVIVGDVLGAETVVTPVSSNTGVEASGRFAAVIRTKIGSPFVISGMASAPGKVVGYEANGGFLLGFAAQGPAGAAAAIGHPRQPLAADRPPVAGPGGRRARGLGRDRTAALYRVGPAGGYPPPSRPRAAGGNRCHLRRA
ncbi:hypothetical protein MASR2M74_07080 [Paracoccaceae bacterium]